MYFYVIVKEVQFIFWPPVVGFFDFLGVRQGGPLVNGDFNGDGGTLKISLSLPKIGINHIQPITANNTTMPMFQGSKTK